MYTCIFIFVCVFANLLEHAGQPQCRERVAIWYAEAILIIDLPTPAIIPVQRTSTHSLNHTGQPQHRERNAVWVACAWSGDICVCLSCLLQRVAACCSILRRVSACCSVLQRAVACCSLLQVCIFIRQEQDAVWALWAQRSDMCIILNVCCSVLQRVAGARVYTPRTRCRVSCLCSEWLHVWLSIYLFVCLSVVQFVAVSYSVIQLVAACCSMLQLVAACCSMLRGVCIFTPRTRCLLSCVCSKWWYVCVSVLVCLL